MPKQKDILELLGDQIQKKAKAKFKSNVEFANVCDISEGTVRRILSGKQNVSLKLLRKVADALGVKISDLMKEIGN